MADALKLRNEFLHQPQLVPVFLQRCCLLVAIHNQHYIYETLVRVVENPGLITKGEIDSYGNPQAVGCYRCRSIDFF